MSLSHRPPCRSSQDPDLHRVAAAMKEHAASVGEPQASAGIDAPPHGTSEIWRRVYAVDPLSVSFNASFTETQLQDDSMKVDICPVRELEEVPVGGA